MNFTTAKIAVDKFINEVVKNKVEEAQITIYRLVRNISIMHNNYSN